LREPGARVEALETCSAVTSVGFFIGLWFAFWVNMRVRGRPRRSAEDGLFVQPYYPLGSRVRAWTIGIGILTTLFSIAYVMKLIEAFVWEQGGRLHDVGMSYSAAWLGLWLLVMAVADYRRSLFGPPQRTLTGELSDDIEWALIQRDFREAIRWYQQAFSDADRAEARAFVFQRLEEIRRQKPQELAAAAPRLWNLNWRYMAACALMLAPLVVAFWSFMPPISPMGIAVGWGVGTAIAVGITMASHLVSFGKRVLALLPPAAALIVAGVMTDNASPGGGFGRSMLVGTCCGATVMFCGFTRKRRRRPNTE
jgi:hypothetical protein